MEQLNIGLAVVGGLVLVVGLLSSPLECSWFSAVFAAEQALSWPGRRVV